VLVFYITTTPWKMQEAFEQFWGDDRRGGTSRRRVLVRCWCWCGAGAGAVLVLVLVLFVVFSMCQFSWRRCAGFWRWRDELRGRYVVVWGDGFAGGV
jgi:hypothetical protein